MERKTDYWQTVPPRRTRGAPASHASALRRGGHTQKAARPPPARERRRVRAPAAANAALRRRRQLPARPRRRRAMLASMRRWWKLDPIPLLSTGVALIGACAVCEREAGGRREGGGWLASAAAAAARRTRARARGEAGAPLGGRCGGSHAATAHAALPGGAQSELYARARISLRWCRSRPARPAPSRRPLRPGACAAPLVRARGMCSGEAPPPKPRQAARDAYHVAAVPVLGAGAALARVGRAAGARAQTYLGAHAPSGRRQALSRPTPQQRTRGMPPEEDKCVACGRVPPVAGPQGRRAELHSGAASTTCRQKRPGLRRLCRMGHVLGLWWFGLDGGWGIVCRVVPMPPNRRRMPGSHNAAIGP